jgi:hypothetical protein
VGVMSHPAVGRVGVGVPVFPRGSLNRVGVALLDLWLRHDAAMMRGCWARLQLVAAGSSWVAEAQPECCMPR